MIDILYVILYFTFPVYIFRFMKKNNIDPYVISVKSVSLLSMFIFSYIGTFPLYFGLNDYMNNMGVLDKDIIFKIFIFSSWSITFLIICFIFVEKFLKYYFGPESLSSPRPLENIEKKTVCFLLFFCLFVIAIYLMKIQKIAIWAAITEGPQAAALARSKMGNDFSGKYHWYTLIMHDLLNLITFTLFANFLIVKRRIDLFLFLLSIIFAIFTSIMATEKNRLIVLFLGLFFTYLITKKSGKAPLRLTLILVCFLFVPLIFFFIYFMGVQDPLSALSAIFARIFNVQIFPAYCYLEFFPNHHDFLWGRSFPNPRGIFPFEPYRLTVEVMNWKFPNLAQEGIVGSMPTVFWGELYANFGYFGILFGPIALGVLIGTVSYFSSKLEKTPLTIGLYIWIILHYITISQVGISAFLIDFYLIGILCIVLCATAICNIKNIIGKRIKYAHS